MASKDSFQHALACNTRWANDTASANPALFPSLVKGQAPTILWIGCADSRVPETTILGLAPGDVFVHRNIANIVSPADLSLSAVLTYAVSHLHVSHIVLAGHTCCGGVAGALGSGKLGGVLDSWLQPLRALRARHAAHLEVDAAAKEAAGLEGRGEAQALAELNVREGVRLLRENPVVVDAEDERGLKVHGIMYDVGTGTVKELDVAETPEERGVRKHVFKTV